MALFKKKSDQTPSMRVQHPYTDLPMILASGIGRSGTTVLRHCLNAHPEINCFNHEGNYICDLLRVAKMNLEFEIRAASLPVALSSYWRLHQQMVLNLFWPVEHISASDHSTAIATYSMLDRHAARGLTNAFPCLAICNIIRNGIEVVSSYMSFPAFKHMSFTEVCHLWKLRTDMFKYCERHEHAFLFRYEWFQQGNLFRDQLAKAFAFIGMEYHAHCDKPMSRTFHPTTFDGEPKDAARDMSRRKDRWKYWTRQQREEFEKICGAAMEIQGYEMPWT